MLILVRVIDLLVEYVKYLAGAQGHRNPAARIAAWVLLLTVVGVVVALISWGVSEIPALIDVLNGS